MVQISPEREVITERVVDDSGPATAMVVMFSLLIIAVLGFMAYYFSNSNMSNSTPSTIIERTDTTTNTTTPVPVQVPAPAPVAPAPAPEPATP